MNSLFKLTKEDIYDCNEWRYNNLIKNPLFLPESYLMNLAKLAKKKTDLIKIICHVNRHDKEKECYTNLRQYLAIKLKGYRF